MLFLTPIVSKGERQCILAIQQKLLRMIPMLSTISAYIRACRPSEQEAVIAWLHDALDHVRDDKLDHERLKHIEASGQRDDSADAWRGLLHKHLAEPVPDLLQFCAEVKTI